MSKDAKGTFEDYVPEILEFDEEIDGCDEHKIRDEHLSAKEKILKDFKEKQANKRVYRHPIRTENEKT
ncbi:hypothetical protein M947_06065 [Sulfurimonas hongkongensis]|uniref:Uncharacterized protein n=1 Tax=Sulfurimonas hongkongensis TaxID=1172190 RepID=T0KR85_9BACT|nr:hypothetical protein [Sulfurimonas hongkongensis]EQB39554.1 hypothetical protein M947_06065 [Sulfurimonas hongkongensis]